MLDDQSRLERMTPSDLIGCFDHLLDCFGLYSAVRDDRERVVDFHVEYVNTAACEANLLTPAEQIGQRLTEILPSHEPMGLIQRYTTVVETGEPWEVQALEVHETYGGEDEQRWFDIRVWKVGDGIAAVWRDVTDRERARQRLERQANTDGRQVEKVDPAAATERLSQAQVLIDSITRGTGDAIAAQDFDHRYIYFNEAYRQEFNRLWEADLVVGLSMVEALAPWPEEQRRAMDLWRRALDGETFTVTAEFGPEATRQVYDLHFHPLFDEAGRQLGAAHIIRNVTRRVELERAARASDKRFREMADAAPAMLWVTNPDHQCTFLSRGWFDYTGQTAEQGRGLGWTEAVHPEDREMAAKTFLAAADRRESFRLDYRLRRHDGVYRWAMDSGQPHFDDGDQLLGYVGSVIDIHDRKQAEAALAESERSFRGVFEHTATGLALGDHAGRIHHVNRQFAELVGRSEEQIVHMDFRDFTHPEDLPREEALIQQTLRGEIDNYAIRKRYVRPNGEAVWVLFSGAVEREGSAVRLTIGAAQDITALVDAEARLQQMNSSLEARVEERTDLARRRSEQVRQLSLEVIETEERERQRLAVRLHDDLQQMLAAVRMRLGMLKGHLPQAQQSMWGQVDELMGQTIGAVRSLAVEISPPVLHDNGLGGSLTWLSRRFREQHQLTVHLELDGDAEPQGEHLQAFLFRSARELLFNVVKHAETNEAWLALTASDGMVQIEVRDAGRGCDTQAIGGTGLGLQGIIRRAEHLGGWCRIRSEGGDGCAVTLAVPAKL